MQNIAAFNDTLPLEFLKQMAELRERANEAGYGGGAACWLQFWSRTIVILNSNEILKSLIVDFR